MFQIQNLKILQYGSIIGWLKDLKSSSTRSFQIQKFGTRSSSKIGFIPGFSARSFQIPKLETHSSSKIGFVPSSRQYPPKKIGRDSTHQ